MNEVSSRPEPGAAFVEKVVAVDGFEIRYREAGEGPVVVALHGAGGSRISGTHDILSESFRVLAFEAPGFGVSAENTRHKDMMEMAKTMLAAVAALGIESYSIIGNSFGGRLALCMGVQDDGAIDSLVLVGPAAIREGGEAPVRTDGSHENVEAVMYAHPENMPPIPAPDPEVAKKQGALVQRLRGPDRDADLEAKMAGLEIPVLVLLGTEDRRIPPSVGRIYKQILPKCFIAMIYDAAHAMDAERPEAVAEIAGDFMTRKDQFLVKDTDSAVHP